MQLVIEDAKLVKDCKYTEEERRPLMLRETEGMDYNSAVVLLRNLGDKKDTTPLEREALASAVRILRKNIDTKKP